MTTNNGQISTVTGLLSILNVRTANIMAARLVTLFTLLFPAVGTIGCEDGTSEFTDFSDVASGVKGITQTPLQRPNNVTVYAVPINFFAGVNYTGAGTLMKYKSTTEENGKTVYNYGSDNFVYSISDDEDFDCPPSISVRAQKQDSGKPINGWTQSAPEIPLWREFKPYYDGRYVCFYRKTDFNLKLTDIPTHELTVKDETIAIGHSESTVQAKFGNPARIDDSEYGFEWHIYNQDYENYFQIGINDGEVVAFATNAIEFGIDGLDVESSRLDVTTNFGHYDLDDNLTLNYELAYPHRVRGSHVRTFFKRYDYQSDKVIAEKDQKLNAVMVIRDDFYDAPKIFSQDAIDGLEREAVDFINGYRVKIGVPTHEWCDMASDASAKHSKDMYVRNFVEHTNPDGMSSRDRLTAEGIKNIEKSSEYIALTLRSPLDLEQHFSNDPCHVMYVLSGEGKTGIGLFYSSSSRWNYYWTWNSYRQK